MKRFIFLLIVLFNIYGASAQLTDSIIDSRDGHNYKIVKIGQQWWMAENLKATKYTNDVAIPLVKDKSSWAALSVNDKAYCFYNNSDSLWEIYGALYTWAAATNGSSGSDENPSGIQGICPIGFHLPSDSEWKELELFLGISDIELDIDGFRGTDEGGKLKEQGFTHWLEPNSAANNSSGFTALPTGFRDTLVDYVGLGVCTLIWSSTEEDSLTVWIRLLNSTFKQIGRHYFRKNFGLPVRCVKNKVIEQLHIDLVGTNTSSIGISDGSIDLTITGGFSPYNILWSNNSTYEDLSNLSAGVYKVTVTDASDSTVTDSIRIYDTFIDERDGQRYKVITIGNQIWMQENLNIGIRINSTQGTYNDDIIEKYCYNNIDAMCDTYGGLYNWGEMMYYDSSYYGNAENTQGICPAGWHVPTDDDWTILITYLGGEDIAGGKLKETGTKHWTSPNTGATDESGFTAISGGYRHYDGTFEIIGSNGYWWSSTLFNFDRTWFRNLDYNSNYVTRDNNYKTYGFSVRCIKNIIDTLKISLSVNHTSNINGADGEIDLTIIGGLAPYSISWSNGSTNEDISNLTAGVYSVTVTDARDSTVIDSIRIYDTFVDNRDGKRYKAIKIRDQVWMAENLNVGKFKQSINTGTVHSDVSDNDTIEKYCYDNNIDNCNIYGGLYDWNEMMDYNPSDSGILGKTQGICPTDWHIPSDNEWKILEIELGMSASEADSLGFRGTDQGTQLKEGGSSGFEALLAGSRGSNSGGFNNIGSYGYFWSSTKINGGRRVTFLNPKIDRAHYFAPNGLSVRCLKYQCDSLSISFITTNPSCYGDSDGKITLQISGGNEPYKYYWSTGDTTKDIDNLTAGLYKIVVKYSIGCFTIDSIEITDPLPLMINLESAKSCFGDSTGSISSNVTGGIAPYRYLWNNDQTIPNLLNLSKGIYLLTVTDNNECIEIATDTVMEFSQIQTSQITGHVTVEPAEVYQYSVSQQIGAEFNWIVEGGNIVSGQGTNTINIQWGNSGNGKISVIETDKNLCQGDTVSLEVNISTGYYSPSMEQIKVIPNPFNEYTTLRFNNPEGSQYKLYLMDLSGKVCRIDDDITESEYILEKGNLKQGFYLIELRGPNIYRGKIVIE